MEVVIRKEMRHLLYNPQQKSIMTYIGVIAHLADASIASLRLSSLMAYCEMLFWISMSVAKPLLRRS